mmetsp:Transcript_78288/g.199039  ORF Transcript_78288/g.199039 Transcript_78288/m.199039 type:complete len:388 (+) Transcript_78288:295-1458(+)
MAAASWGSPRLLRLQRHNLPTRRLPRRCAFRGPRVTPVPGAAFDARLGRLDAPPHRRAHGPTGGGRAFAPGRRHGRRRELQRPGAFGTVCRQRHVRGNTVVRAPPAPVARKAVAVPKGTRPRRGHRWQQTAVRAFFRAAAAGGAEPAVQERVPAHRHADVQPPARLRLGLPRCGRCGSRLPSRHVQFSAAGQGRHPAGRQFFRGGLFAEPHDPAGVHQFRRPPGHRRGVGDDPGFPHVAVARRSAEDQPISARCGSHLVAPARALAAGLGQRLDRREASASVRPWEPLAAAALDRGAYRTGAETILDKLGRTSPAHVLHGLAALVRVQRRLIAQARTGLHRLEKIECQRRAGRRRRARACAEGDPRPHPQDVHSRVGSHGGKPSHGQ